ncbi:16S rRNA (adenine(1518)-N(6)/adenine(1519)-N(6))-dimethyltransferase RsmA [Patescibacteria group bacterium]|nr:16S rRNA (adenine(1518)-N(6)/adenine(1519)-N(6))-dimethyltransferase RsmA [Patescibacteria group bacterium]
MRPKKSLGQNFLMHRQIAERIVQAAEVTKDDTVMEIGPGTGMLTRVLLGTAKKVIAVEADGELVAELNTTFATEIADGRLTLIHDDIRNVDPQIFGSYRLVANIPYYITGEIIRMFLTTNAKPRSMTLLVQKEVAERIARSKKESVLSIAVKTYGTPRYCFTVPRGAFRPAPNVDSAVLTITDIQAPFSSLEEEEWFFTVLKTGFMHKRKQLAKNLEEIAPGERVKEALMEAEVSATVRPEDVPLSSWKAIARKVRI